MESLFQIPELTQGLLDQLAPYGIILAVFSFMYAALGRSKIFQTEKYPRIILSGVLSVYSGHLVQASSWDHILMVTAGVVTSGIIGLLIYHVAMNKGKTKQQSEEEKSEQSTKQSNNSTKTNSTNS